MQQVIAFALVGWVFLIGPPWARQVRQPVPPAASLYLQIIVVKTSESLDHVMALLGSGQDFAQLAQKHSTHSTASGGGVWGPLRLNDLPEAVSARIDKAAEGELIHFFDPTLGHTILKKISSDTARKIGFQLAFDSGAAHLQRGEKETALKEMKRAVALDPQSAAAHQLLGQAYLSQGSYAMISEARAEFVQAIALDPNLIWARFYLARIYLDLNQPRKAREQLEAASAIRPNVPHLLSLLGEAHRQLGSLDLALDFNRKALAADPSFFIAHYYLGLAYLDLKNDGEAIRELEAAAKPDYPAAEIYLTLGKVYIRKGQAPQAVRLLQKAVAIAPAQPEGHLRLAQAYRLQQQLDLALKEISLAVPEGQRLLSNAYYQQLRVEVFFERGLILQGKGEFAMAIEAYTSALELNPNHGPTHRQIAEVLLSQGQYARAAEHAAKAEELKSPVDPSLLEKIKAKQRPD
ncbi:MAG TPA: tetratricopeptide repeat protein [Blastocatellia bacterium]|jgi:tetratricopeptide (TPR) repeat protein|nr:tetratricopeptide repeat protein [Blastocatellia bacterium]